MQVTSLFKIHSDSAPHASVCGGFCINLTQFLFYFNVFIHAWTASWTNRYMEKGNVLKPIYSRRDAKYYASKILKFKRPPSAFLRNMKNLIWDFWYVAVCNVVEWIFFNYSSPYCYSVGVEMCYLLYKLHVFF